MTKMMPVAAWLLLGSFPLAAAYAEPATRATIPEGLHSLVSDADYPDEAIWNEEEGSVAFTLDIDSAGKPARCSIRSSSGSSVLDAATCHIMMERARFQPARNARGKPVPDEISSRLTWRLPDEAMPPRMEAAFTLWMSCVMGEAAKFAPGGAPVDEIAQSAFPPCASLEAIAAREMEAPVPLVEPRKGLVRMIEQVLQQTRNTLNNASEKEDAQVP